jgi:hypothetical protein
MMAFLGWCLGMIFLTIVGSIMIELIKKGFRRGVKK